MPRMTKEHRDILKKHDQYLRNNISLKKNLLSLLFQGDYLDEAERDDIQGTPNRREQVDELLTTLKQKDDKAFDALIDALIEDGQSAVAEELKGDAVELPKDPKVPVFQAKNMKISIKPRVEDEDTKEDLESRIARVSSNAGKIKASRKAIAKDLGENIQVRNIQIKDKCTTLSLLCKKQETLDFLSNPESSAELVRLITTPLFGKVWSISDYWKLTVEESPPEFIVMISYSWKQSGVVDKIEGRLATEGFGIWRDKKDMGDSLMAGMADGLQRATVILTCLSSDYEKSENCMREIIGAERARKKFIALIVQKGFNLNPVSELGLLVKDRVWIDVYDEATFPTQMDEVVRRLEKIEEEGPEERPDEPQPQTDPAGPSQAAPTITPVPGAPNGTQEDEKSKHHQKQVLLSKEGEKMKPSYTRFLRGNRANLTTSFIVDPGSQFLDELVQHDVITAAQLTQIKAVGPIAAIKSGCLLDIMEKRLGTHFKKFCVLLWSDGNEAAAAEYLKKLKPDDQQEIFGKLAPWPKVEIDQ